MNIFSLKSTGQDLVPSRQDNYLARDILLKEAGNPHYVRMTMRLTVAGFAAFLVWAAIAQVNIVSRAPGTILPQSAVQVVQHLDGGRIAKIAVREGEPVRAGQLLVKLDDSEALADLKTSQARYWSLFARAERLKAFIAGRSPDYSKIPTEFRGLVRDEQTILNVNRQARQDQARVLQAQLRQTTSEAGVLGEIAAIRGDLARDQLVSRTSYLDTQRTLVQLQGQAAALRSQIAALGSDQNRSAAEQLSPALSELLQVQEQVKKFEDRLARTSIRAPMDGVVQGLLYKTVGGVIPPGAQVTNVIPARDTVEAEVRVAASDVGHVKVGQPVRIKVSTFDFLRYGAFDGKVSMVAANSTVTDQGDAYYLTKVKLDAAQLNKMRKDQKLQSGMTLEADIITDRQSVLRYLLRPIYAAFANSFWER